MLPLIAALAAPAHAQEDPELRGGLVVGVGRGTRMDTGTHDWAGLGGMSVTLTQGVLYVPAALNLLVVKTPPGSVFFPELTGGVGVAPWGVWGPHAAAMVGAGARFTGVMAQAGWLAGVGLGPVQIDVQQRFGWQSYEPSAFRSLTVQLSLQLEMDAPT